MIRLIYCFILLLCAENAQAANNADMPQALAQLKILTQLTTYSYDYTVKNTFPDASTLLAKGNVNLDLNSKSIAENGNYSTTILTNTWYYKAEHTNKTVHIVNMSNYYKKNKHAVQLDQFFDSKKMTIPDSIFLKYGKLELFTIKNNIVSIRFKFSKLMNFDTYEIIFDTKNKLPISIYVKMNSSSTKGIVYQEFRAFKFSKTLLNNCFSTQPLFEIKGSTIILKKYKNYKPHFEL